MRHRPTIVHFSGHAEGGRILLEDENGRMQPVEGTSLAGLLRVFRDTLRMAVLNACFTAGYDELEKVVDYTIGTTSALEDSAAIRFSGCFYQALAFGRSVLDAYELAKGQLIIEKLADENPFTLLVQDGVHYLEPFLKKRARSPSAENHPLGAESATTGGKESFAFGSESTRSSVESIQENGTTVAKRDLEGRANPHSRITRSVEDQAPPELRTSLDLFRRDHPVSRQVAFLMMRFGKTKAHENIVAGVRSALDPLGITVVRADDKQYHDDLFPNVLTYVYGCSFGIAVFERIETEEFNPNVAMEVGYMFALKKQVCLLKDKTLKTLHADLVGKLYRIFDPFEPVGTIPPELSRWLSDKGLRAGA